MNANKAGDNISALADASLHAIADAVELERRAKLDRRLVPAAKRARRAGCGRARGGIAMR